MEIHAGYADVLPVTIRRSCMAKVAEEKVGQYMEGEVYASPTLIYEKRLISLARLFTVQQYSP